jgi:hypothetical protein
MPRRAQAGLRERREECAPARLLHRGVKQECALLPGHGLDRAHAIGGGDQAGAAFLAPQEGRVGLDQLVIDRVGEHG